MKRQIFPKLLFYHDSFSLFCTYLSFLFLGNQNKKSKTCPPPTEPPNFGLLYNVQVWETDGQAVTQFYHLCASDDMHSNETGNLLHTKGILKYILHILRENTAGWIYLKMKKTGSFINIINNLDQIYKTNFKKRFLTSLTLNTGL